MFSKWEDKPRFNAVIEGGFWSNDGEFFYDSHFKLVNISCLNNLVDESFAMALCVKDESKKYTIQGQSRLLLSSSCREIELPSSLQFYRGVILRREEDSFIGHDSYLIDRVNSIFTREGLVFLDEDMINYLSYMEIIDSLEESAYNIFNCKKFDELYRKTCLDKK